MSQRSTKNNSDSQPYQASEELYQALFEQAADGIFIADSQGRCIDVNKHGCEMLGYTREELMGFSMNDLIRVEDLARDPLQIDKVGVDSPLLKERLFRCKDGRLLPVEISAQMLTDGRYLGIVRDVSKRRQAEKQLRESNERFRLLAESSLTGIYLIVDNLFRHVNPALAHIFGYDVEEIVDKLGPMDLIYIDDRPAISESIRRSILGEDDAFRHDFRGLRKDGGVIDVDVHGRRIEYDGQIGLIGTLIDITERKQVENALRASEEQLQLALDAAQMGLWYWDIITGDVVWSKKCLALYGLPPDTQINYERFMEAIHPEDRERISNALNRAVEENVDYDEQKRNVWPDGTIHWTASRGNVYYNAEGKPSRMMGVTFDISKWKAAEEDRQTHLWFLESLDSVNRTMQGTNDLDQMMSGVLDLMLSIFDCDQAWLVHPFDTEAATWRLMMERSRLGHPVAFPIGSELSLEPEGVEVFKILEAANGPVQFGPHAEHPVPTELAQGLGVQSSLSLALYPKVSRPWSIGLYQSTYPRVWTPEEQWLFHEIGRRLADSLTSLLTYRNLLESEEKFSVAFQYSPSALSVVSLKDEIYLEVNDGFLQATGYTYADVIGHTGKELNLWAKPEQRRLFWQLFKEQGAVNDFEFLFQKKNGQLGYALTSATLITINGESCVLAHSNDITKRKQVEDELRQNREATLHFSQQLTVLQGVTNELSKASSTDDLCRQAVQLAHTHFGFDRIGIWFVGEDQSMMQGSFGIDEHGQLRDERKAKLAFRPTELSWQVFTQKESKALVVRQLLYNHEGDIVGEGDNAMAALWDGDRAIGIISVDNLLSQQPITERQLEVLRLFATTLGHLITRKRTQEALTLFRTLVDKTTDAIEVIDPATGKFLDANEQAYQNLGYTREEFMNLSVSDINVVVGTQSWQKSLEEIQSKGFLARESQHRRKDGSIIPVEININYIRLDRDYILAIVRDIADRKQAEIEQNRLLVKIQEQAKQVQNIIDTVPEGVVLLNKDQLVTLTNPVARQFLALLAPDFENGRLTQLGERPLHEILTSPPKGLWHEITIDNLVFEAITRPVENGPRNGGWVLVLRDITQERDIQERIQRQERLAAVGQLAAGIAHDFNNILAVIALYTQLISRTVEMPARVQERLHTVEQQISRATDLIQQILDFSRQSVLERQPVNLLPFMENLVKLLERALPENIQIELEHVAEAYFIQADPSRIQQVVMNLAVNARDAMPDGGYLKISLEHVQTKKPKPISVQNLPPGDWIQIEVADSGDGITQDVLSHIFEPFFTTKEVGAGTGLGLAQVYGIVQQHEGYIDVATKIGEGTTFVLYFPALTIGSNVIEMPVKGTLQSGQGQKILLVEDDTATRGALRDSLAQLNYDVVLAKNGREALAILATQAAQIDLVLSDVVMPEMGGVALFHAMNEQKLTIPVVLLTGHPLSNEMENLREMGLAGWLPKPPDLVSLSNLLAKNL